MGIANQACMQPLWISVLISSSLLVGCGSALGQEDIKNVVCLASSTVDSSLVRQTPDGGIDVTLEDPQGHPVKTHYSASQKQRMFTAFKKEWGSMYGYSFFQTLGGGLRVCAESLVITGVVLAVQPIWWLALPVDYFLAVGLYAWGKTEFLTLKSLADQDRYEEMGIRLAHVVNDGVYAVAAGGGLVAAKRKFPAVEGFFNAIAAKLGIKVNPIPSVEEHLTASNEGRLTKGLIPVETFEDKGATITVFVAEGVLNKAVLEGVRQTKAKHWWQRLKPAVRLTERDGYEIEAWKAELIGRKAVAVHSFEKGKGFGQYVVVEMADGKPIVLEVPVDRGGFGSGVRLSEGHMYTQHSERGAFLIDDGVISSVEATFDFWDRAIVLHFADGRYLEFFWYEGDRFYLGSR